MSSQSSFYPTNPICISKEDGSIVWWLSLLGWSNCTLFKNSIHFGTFFCMSKVAVRFSKISGIGRNELFGSWGLDTGFGAIPHFTFVFQRIPNDIPCSLPALMLPGLSKWVRLMANRWNNHRLCPPNTPPKARMWDAVAPMTSSLSTRATYNLWTIVCAMMSVKVLALPLGQTIKDLQPITTNIVHLVHALPSRAADLLNKVARYFVHCANPQAFSPCTMKRIAFVTMHWMWLVVLYTA